MTEEDPSRRREVSLYMERAQEALEVAAHNIDDRHIGDYDIKGKITARRAKDDLEDARHFVSRVESYLKEDVHTIIA